MIARAHERMPLRTVTASLAARPLLALAPFAVVYLAIPFLAPANANLYDDEAGYLGLARLLTHGDFLTGRDNLVTGGPAYPNLWFGPGLPLVLTPFVALHVPVEVIRLLGPLFLFAAVVALFFLLRLFTGRGPALAGALALALYVPLYTVVAFVHSEPLALLLVVLGVYGSVRYARGRRPAFFVLGATSLAWLALTRVEYGWVVSAVAVLLAIVWALRRDARAGRVAAVFAAGVVLCAPWLAYTYSVSGAAFEWGSSGALSLYWMTSPYAGDRGDWHGADSVFADPRLAPHRPLFRHIAPRTLSEQNAELVRAARRNVARHPLKFARNVADNLSRMLFNVPYSFKPAKASGLVYSVPAALLLASLAVAAVRRRRRLPFEARAAAIFAVVTLALHAVLSGYPRLLFPIVPLAILLVVVWSTGREPADG